MIKLVTSLKALEEKHGGTDGGGREGGGRAQLGSFSFILVGIYFPAEG